MATTTITTTAGEDARIVVAFGHYLQLPGSATQPQVKAAIIDFVRTVVLNDERKVAADAAVVAAYAGVTLIAPT